MSSIRSETGRRSRFDDESRHPGQQPLKRHFPDVPACSVRPLIDRAYTCCRIGQSMSLRIECHGNGPSGTPALPLKFQLPEGARKSPGSKMLQRSPKIALVAGPRGAVQQKRLREAGRGLGDHSETFRRTMRRFLPKQFRKTFTRSHRCSGRRKSARGLGTIRTALLPAPFWCTKRVDRAHFDWRWRERPARALLAWEAKRDPPTRLRRIRPGTKLILGQRLLPIATWMATLAMSPGPR